MKTRKFTNKDNKRIGNRSNLITAIATIGLVCAAALGFYDNHFVARIQTSMDFCTLIYPILQSEEFIEREQYLISTLCERQSKQAPCSIDELSNDTLRREIIRYCECLNGIGILLHEHMISSDVIVPYIGTKTTILYELLRPYLNLTRKKMSAKAFECFDVDDNHKIQNAAALYFVHYELLALEMRTDGPKICKQLHRQLVRKRKKNRILE